jgi:hypothetical protein
MLFHESSEHVSYLLGLTHLFLAAILQGRHWYSPPFTDESQRGGRAHPELYGKQEATPWFIQDSSRSPLWGTLSSERWSHDSLDIGEPLQLEVRREEG